MLVDGDARVACVTPAARVQGRVVTTLAGLDPAVSAALADALVATGGSQCGFCTPGIIVRLAALQAKGKTARTDIERGLAAHLCRCTGWQPIFAATDFLSERGGHPHPGDQESRLWAAAEARAGLESSGVQQVGTAVPMGDAGFADDTAPRDALVAVPCPPGSTVETVTAAGAEWVLGETLDAARRLAGKTQGRRTTVADTVPFALPDLPAGGVRLATSWVEPAYLEPDASWCVPDGTPAGPLANGGAFGGKVASIAPAAAAELAAALARPVRVVFAREDVVRLGPKRPPIAGSAVAHDGRIEVRGVAAASLPVFATPYAVELDVSWTAATVAGPPVSTALRAVGLAEQTVLVEGALDAAGWDRAALVEDDARAAHVLLDTVAATATGALAGARVEIDATTGRITGVRVRVDAGDPLDEVVLRSYATGAVHMALGWVLTEAIAVDPVSGEVLDLTIRSFGIVRPQAMPPVEIEIVASTDAPRAAASDAVFAAVAAAAWNAVARTDGERPERFPAVDARAARMLRR